MTVESATIDTFPKLLLHHARERGDAPAIREKDLGIWQTWTWGEVAAEVRALACGLAARGFKRGDTLASVARAFQTTVASIKTWNPRLLGDRLTAGQRLTVYRIAN